MAVVDSAIYRYSLRTLITGVVAAIFFINGGCQSHQKIVDQAHQHYWRGEWDQSASTLADAIKRPKRDTDVLTLDQAMVEFQRGNLAQSQKLFRSVRDRFAEQPIGKLAINSASYLSDESHRVYSAEDHEKVLLQVMLAFGSLLRHDGDAVAYAHQIGDQCQLLLENRPLQMDAPSDQNNQPTRPIAAQTTTQSTISIATTPDVDLVRQELAVAPLLRSLVRGQSRLNHDELIRNLQQANEWRPASPFLQSELARAVNNEQAPTGYGTLYLFALVGRGPRKIEVSEPVSSQALLIADQILTNLGNYSLPPTIAPIRIAKIQRIPLSLDGLEIIIDERRVGITENIADIGKLAEARQTELMPAIVARGVARRIVKKGVVVAGKKASGVDKNKKTDLTSFAYDAAGVIWEASEKADLRCWSLLPGSIQIMRVDLPVGQHKLDAIPNFNGRPVGNGFSGMIEILDGRSTFAVAAIADGNSPGQLVRGQP